QRSGEETEEASDFADAVTHRVPGDLRLAQPELLHQLRLHLEAIATKRRQCPDCATEFADQDARPQLREPLAVALHRREQCRHLKAEGERHRLLQIAPAGYRRVAIAPR